MRNDHPSTQQLEDFAEELLAPAQRDSVTAHLARCAACREESQRRRALVDELRALPRELQPGVDLRPGILLAVQRRSAARGRRGVLQEMRWALSAAAGILVVVTATITILLVQTPGSDARRLDVPTNFALLEREYVRAADELARALEGERERLSPETLELMAQSLRSVERALAESRAALNEDPVSPALKELVLAAHRHRLDVLRRAAVMMVGT